MPVLRDAKHERFAVLVATQGKSDMQAYQEAYGCDPDSAESNAWRVRGYEGVEQRIIDLKQSISAHKVLTLAKKREFLHDLVTTPPDQITESSPLANGVRTTKHGRDVLIPDKLAALKLDAQLAGELTERSQVDIRVGVFMAAADERPAIDVEQTPSPPAERISDAVER